MNDAKRKVAIVIGVSDARPLPFLPGALNGARDFAAWAQAMGYETRLVTDEENKVTVIRLRSEIEQAINPQSDTKPSLEANERPIYRLVIYFAGHGLIREAEEGLWLMSDWYNELRAVAVEPFKRRLFAYDVQQISIFADACRELPKDIVSADLVPDAVLGRGPKAVVTNPPVDKFIAAQDGALEYMIPGATPEDDLCLFSGVLMQGLWGANPAAISALVAGTVTSSSLGTYLRNEVPKVAGHYQRKLNPAVYPVLPDGDNVYFDAAVAPPAPVFKPWPAFEPAPATPGVGPLLRLGGMVARSLPILPPQPPAFPPFAPTGPETVQPESLQERMRGQSGPTFFDTGAGVGVDGSPVRALWSTPSVTVKPDMQAGWWSVGEGQQSWLRQPAPLMIEFEDGLFAATVALPEFTGAILRDAIGVPALVYREVYSQPKDYQGAEQAIVAMEDRALRADQATDLAIQLRQSKHQDPVLGVISAYLYDAIGDTDSIRRMAGYYIQQNQPIPYDIALLAVVRGEFHDDQLWVHIPPVPARSPRTDAEAQHNWCYSSMPEAVGIVGGWWPWMRQGWAFLEDPIDLEKTLIRPGLADLALHLSRSRFTTLDAAGGQRLAALFKLERRA